MSDETNTGTSETTATPPAQTADEKKFTQAEVDRFITERLDREKRQATEQAKKAAEDAAAKALKDSADFKTLSETQAQALLERETDLAQYKTQAETATTERDLYKAALEKYVKGRRQTLPDSINALLEALDPVAQMAWLDKNADKFGATVAPGNGQSPKPAAKAGTAANEKEAQNRSRNFYQNAF